MRLLHGMRARTTVVAVVVTALAFIAVAVALIVVLALALALVSSAAVHEVTVQLPWAKRMPASSTGSRQRLRACKPAASHSNQSDIVSGDSQRHFGFAILGSPIVLVFWKT